MPRRFCLLQRFSRSSNRWALAQRHRHVSLRARAPSFAFGGTLLLTTCQAVIETGGYELDPTEVLHLERRVDTQGVPT
jgi:hypothetical protein